MFIYFCKTFVHSEPDINIDVKRIIWFVFAIAAMDVFIVDTSHIYDEVLY